MTSALAHYQVLSFDCYGTLIDWEAGIWSALQPLFAANRATPDRERVLAVFARLESDREAAEPASPYSRLLADVHRDLADGLGMESNNELDQTFGASVGDWPVFPDSHDALAKLGKRYRMVILSNVDREGFEGSRARLGTGFDAVYTAEDIGSYKPDPANFDYLVDHVSADLDVAPGSVLHVAQSLFHDHGPAKAAGLDTAWIDRQRLSDGGSWGATLPVDDWPTPDHVYFSLADLAVAAGVG